MLQADEKPILAAGVPDPTVGLYSSTSSNKVAVLNQAVNEGMEDIVAGTRVGRP